MGIELEAVRTRLKFLWLSTCYSLLVRTIYCKTKRDLIVSFSGFVTRDENLRSFISPMVKFVDYPAFICSDGSGC